MSMERNALQNYRTEKRVVKTATATLTPKETIVEVNCAAGAVTLTLPPPSLCQGKIFSIRQVDATANATIQDGDDSVDWEGDITLNALHDRCVLFCDGVAWSRLSDMFT